MKPSIHFYHAILYKKKLVVRKATGIAAMYPKYTKMIDSSQRWLPSVGSVILDYLSH
ncbi:MAG: hypothetical protein JRN32_02365 [Nitrososphaerota archaeon]|nr:hypothetical protein [Nitrososphaerota archaeon]